MKTLTKIVLFVIAVFLWWAVMFAACQAESEIENPQAAATIANLREVEAEKNRQASKIEEQKEAATERELTEKADVTKKETAERVNTYYDVPLDRELQDYIIRLCEESNIDPAIMFALISKESNYKASAMGDGGNSYGLCQVQPYWHSGRMAKLGCTDLLDPFQNVTVAVDYLAELLDWYDGDIAKALTAYNRGSYSGFISDYAYSVIARAETLKGGV